MIEGSVKVFVLVEHVRKANLRFVLVWNGAINQ